MRRKFVILLVCIVALASALTGCDKGSPPTNNDPASQSQSGQAQTPDQQNAPHNGQQMAKVTLYYATQDAMFLVPRVSQMPQTDAPAATAVNMLIRGDEAKDAGKVIPRGTRLLSLEVKDTVAYANFSKEIRQNPGGSASERLIIGSIVNTLTEFPQIKKVKILIDGKSAETLNGHLDLSEPVARDESIIKK